MWKYTKKCVFPHVGKFTIFGVFPHAEVHDLMWISTCGNAYFRGADLHILLCISTCGNSLKTVQIRVRGNTLFLMCTFTLNCVSPHEYTKKCVNPHSGYTHFLVYYRMRRYTKKCVNPHSGYTQFWVHFHKWKFTIISVNPHMLKIKVWWISSSWEIHLFLVYIRMG